VSGLEPERFFGLPFKADFRSDNLASEIRTRIFADFSTEFQDEDCTLLCITAYD